MTTIFSNFVTIALILLIILCCILILIFQDQFSFLVDEKLVEFQSPIKPFITDYRGDLMLNTCIAILAVDFPSLYPRRFAKCESFGISIMDAGVGSFVFSSAIVSQTARGIFKSESLSKRMKRMFASMMPMLVLGFARFFSILLSNYPEHVTEYGVHWNFFFTLAGVSIGVNLIDILFPRLSKYSMVIGIFCAIVQDFILRMGIREYILSDERVGIVGQNKEGIFSLLGYLSIYYLGCGFGQMIHRAKEKNEWKITMIVCWIPTIFWLIVFLILNKYFEVSRRMVNLGYIAFTCLLNTIMVNIHLLISAFTKKSSTTIVNSASTNSLAFFLLANLLTGAINLSIKTLYQGTMTALCILIIYMFSVSFVFSFFVKNKINTIWKIKIR